EKFRANRPIRRMEMRPFMRAHDGFVFGGAHDARLGIQVSPPSPALQEQLDLPKGQGLVVDNVIPDSPAAKAGFKANDILVEVNGKSVSNDPGQLVKMLEDIKANTPVDLLVIRKGKKEPIKGVSLREKPEERRAIRLWTEGAGAPHIVRPPLP